MTSNMMILNRIFMAAGLGTAFYFGYTESEWHYIVISAILFTVGWAVARPGGIITVKQSDGMLGLVKLFTIQMIMMSLFAGVVFFLGFLIG